MIRIKQEICSQWKPCGSNHSEVSPRVLCFDISQWVHLLPTQAPSCCSTSIKYYFLKGLLKCVWTIIYACPIHQKLDLPKQLRDSNSIMCRQMIRSWLPYAADPVGNINNEATAILYDNKETLMECREKILPVLYSCQVSNCYPFFLLGHVVILFNSGAVAWIWSQVLTDASPALLTTELSTLKQTTSTVTWRQSPVIVFITNLYSHIQRLLL